MIKERDVTNLKKKEDCDYETVFELDESIFLKNLPERYKIFQDTYNIIDIYNNYFIDKYGNKLRPQDLVINTTILTHTKNGIKPEPGNLFSKNAKLLKDNLLLYMKSRKKQISKTKDEDKQKYIHFKYTPNIDVTETDIYKQFNAIWSEWGLIDVVNQKPIIDSMCKIIGFIFTPNRAWRYFAVIESVCSGWGKTAFINAICDNTEVYNHYISSTVESDKFSYAAMYKGNDTCIIDDPGKNMHALAGEINNIVSTKRGTVREMNTMGYTADGVETRIVISTNIPFRVKQDMKLDNKMICVKTNAIQDRNKTQQAQIHNLANTYINEAEQDDIDRFISGCVDLLDGDDEWINTHLGLHENDEVLGCKISELLRIQKINGKYIFPTDAATLEQLVNVSLRKSSGLDVANESRYQQLRWSYSNICDALKTKCYNDRCIYNGSLIFMTGKRPKDDTRSFKLTDCVKEALIRMLDACDDSLEFDNTEQYNTEQYNTDLITL